ncbi:MAG: hypothetical protein K2G88_09485 [Oscillospiraceae bacterium]|nr:hypothetical protein [Oscillospiraceae bacterium]
MIVEIHGFPGSGKTTVLTMIAQRALQGKFTLGLPPTKRVFTTFPCPDCYEIDFNNLGKYNFHHCLILIDEISMYADNRNFQKFSEELKYFFKLHRHFHVNVVWCSQSARDADLKIRAVTERSYIIDKYLWFTAIKPILKYHTVRGGQPDEKFELSPPIDWHWCFRPRWYKYFDSFHEPKKLPEPELKLWAVQPVEKVKKIGMNQKIKLLMKK